MYVYYRRCRLGHQGEGGRSVTQMGRNFYLYTAFRFRGMPFHAVEL